MAEPRYNTANPFDVRPEGWGFMGVPANPVQLKGFEALAPHGITGAWSTTLGSRIDKVDHRLTDILSRAAVSFSQKNPGYTVEGFSGKKGRSSGTRWHPGGIAIDVRIKDPQGNILDNYRNARTFRTYEQFAQEARAVQQANYPELDKSFRWGGYFGGAWAADQMHFDLGPTSAMGFGSWDKGLNKAGQAFLPGAQSVGIIEMPTAVAGVPVPEPRPDLVPPGLEVARAPLPDTFGPIGTVERAPLAPPSAESVAPAAYSPESVSPSFADIFSPVGSAYAAPGPSVPSLAPSVPESLSPIGAEETITGREISPVGPADIGLPSGFVGAAAQGGFSPGLGMLSPEATPTGGFEPVSPKTGRFVSAIPDFEYGSLPAAPASIVGPETSLASLAPSGSNSTLYNNPVHEALQPLGSSTTMQPLQAESLAPLSAPSVMPEQAPSISPLTPESVVGTEPMQAPSTPGFMTSPAPTALSQTFSPTNQVQQNTISPVPGVPASPVAAPSPPAKIDAALIDAPFPDAPKISTFDKIKDTVSPIASMAMTGNSVLGPMGLVGGAALGAMQGFGINAGPQFSAALPESERFSTGFGLDAISQAMSGPRGAVGHSLSNPGMSYANLGERVGANPAVGLRRSDKYGWIEAVDASGRVVGIHYDDPSKAGVFGSLSDALSRAFGGGGRGISEKAQSEIDKSKGGLI